MVRSRVGATLLGALASCTARPPPPRVHVEPPVPAESRPVAGAERQSLSAPIFPCHVALGPLPEPPADLAAVAHSISMPYEQLLETCQPQDPRIVVPTGSEPLTEQQILANQAAVSDCAYRRYASKPYWVPKLLSQVDVCGVVLGEPWRLPTEADLSAIPEAELEALRRRQGNGFYYLLKFYVRTTDGLAEANLQQSRAVRPLHSPAGQVVPEHHLEGGIGVRCFRGPGPERPPRNKQAPGWACARVAASKTAAQPVRQPARSLGRPSAAVTAFSRYADRLVGGQQELDIAETRRQFDLVRPDLERAMRVLQEPEPVSAEGAEGEAWRSAKRDKELVLYALQKIDARIDRERKRSGAPAVPHQRERELNELKDDLVELRRLAGIDPWR